MRVEVVCNKDDLFCPWIQGIGSVPEYLCKIQCCTGLRHNSFPPAYQGFGNHEYICNPVADIYGIQFFRLAWFTGDAGFLYELFVRFIYADNRAERVIWTLIDFQHIFHFCHEPGICLRNAPLLYKPRFNLVFFMTSQTVLSVM